MSRDGHTGGREGEKAYTGGRDVGDKKGVYVALGEKKKAPPGSAHLAPIGKERERICTLSFVGLRTAPL